MTQAQTRATRSGYSSTADIMLALQFGLAKGEAADLANLGAVSHRDAVKIIDFVKLADRISNANYDDIVEILKTLEDQYATLSNYVSLMPPNKDQSVIKSKDLSGLRRDIDELDASCKTIQKDLQEATRKRIKAMQEAWHSPSSTVHPQIIKPLVSEIHQAEVKIKQAREHAAKLLEKAANKHAEIFTVATPAMRAMLGIKPTPGS